MTARRGFVYWAEKGYRIAKCEQCGWPMQGTETETGLWCEATALAHKVNPIGIDLYVATCKTSVNEEICHRPHMFVCGKCDRAIEIR